MCIRDRVLDGLGRQLLERRRRARGAAPADAEARSGAQQGMVREVLVPGVLDGPVVRAGRRHRQEVQPAGPVSVAMRHFPGVDGHGAPVGKQLEQAACHVAFVLVPRCFKIRVGVAAADHFPVQRRQLQ
eukprot:10606238-Lingulodinium_polyedra.AAC.1